MGIEQDVLARVKPSPQVNENIHAAVEKLVQLVESTSVAKEEAFEICLVGSIAKGTHLIAPDIDLFMLFDPSLPREKLEEYGLRIGKEAIGGREHYAEHPYIRGEIDGFKTDIVPAYKILDSSQKMSAVDRTPFHTAYVKEHLEAGQQDQVRLLKAFMKGIGTYGAEARTEGFSGYLCELLVLRFGGFGEVLEEASQWKRGERFDLDTDTGRKFDSPLVFIDPVDPNRNVASAVSVDSLSLFMVAASSYLAETKLEYFFPGKVRERTQEEIEGMLAKRGRLLLITLPKLDIIDDILFPQLRKFQRSIEQLLANNDFKVTESWSDVLEEEMVLIFELEKATLPGTLLHEGPPTWVKDNSSDFLKKWRNNPEAVSAPFIRDGRWYVYTTRRHTQAMDLVRHGMEPLDIGKNLNSVKSQVSIDELRFPQGPEVMKALSIFLDKSMPWER